MNSAASILLIITRIFAVVMGLAWIVALVDPVGVKMADDNDPFGTPPTTAESLTWLLVAITLFIGSTYLARQLKNSRLRGDERKK